MPNADHFKIVNPIDLMMDEGSACRCDDPLRNLEISACARFMIHRILLRDDLMKTS